MNGPRSEREGDREVGDQSWLHNGLVSVSNCVGVHELSGKRRQQFGQFYRISVATNCVERTSNMWNKIPPISCAFSHRQDFSFGNEMAPGFI